MPIFTSVERGDLALFLLIYKTLFRFDLTLQGLHGVLDLRLYCSV